MMTVMLNLLKRWAELEPGRCKIRDLVVKTDGFELWIGDVETDEFQALILFAVMESIAAHGFSFNLRYSEALKSYVADVRFIHDGRSRLSSSSYIDNPAKALLGAYLEALEKYLQITKEN